MSEQHEAEALRALQTLTRSGRPSTALARVQRHLGMNDDAAATFVKAGDRLVALADKLATTDPSSARAARVDALEAYVAGEATKAARSALAALLADGDLSDPLSIRLALSSARLGLRETVEMLRPSLADKTLGARIVSAWLESDASAMSDFAEALERALEEPPLGPSEPWGDSAWNDTLRWLRTYCV